MFRYTKGISTKIEMKSVTYPSLGRTAKRLKELEKADFYVVFCISLVPFAFCTNCYILYKITFSPIIQFKKFFWYV